MNSVEIELDRELLMIDLLNLTCCKTDELIKPDENVDVALWDGMELKLIGRGYFTWNSEYRMFDFINEKDSHIEIGCLDDYSISKSTTEVIF